MLGTSIAATDARISTTLGGNDPSIVCAVSGCLNFILDPVEGFVIDGQGRRLGYTTATGALAEIPGSVWFGNADGIGWALGPVEGPLSVSLTGLGEDYYVMLSEHSGAAAGGLIRDGFLAAGEQIDLPLATVDSDGDGYIDQRELVLGHDPMTYCGIMRADQVRRSIRRYGGTE